jgi:copper homeostasis protein
MQTYVLEIAVFTLDGALRAVEGGANRLELCENPNDGGTTPSFGMLKKISTSITIPVFPIIRPRGGDFVYSIDEVEIMKQDILLCKELGYEGIVLGCLDADGNIDIELLTLLTALASPMEVTFHRAFDRSANPFTSLEDIIACGCKRILTSGQCPSVEDGVSLVKKLIELAQDRIIIMPGSGLNSMNVAKIASETGAVEFHTAARKRVHRPFILSPETMQEELSFISVDTQEVSNIRKVLDRM